MSEFVKFVFSSHRERDKANNNCQNLVIFFSLIDPIPGMSKTWTAAAFRAARMIVDILMDYRPSRFRVYESEREKLKKTAIVQPQNESIKQQKYVFTCALFNILSLIVKIK